MSMRPLGTVSMITMNACLILKADVKNNVFLTGKMGEDEQFQFARVSTLLAFFLAGYPNTGHYLAS